MIVDTSWKFESSGTSTFAAKPDNKMLGNIFPVQRRTKQKVVTDFATVTKGASAAAKPRAALRQVLFSQGASEKNPTSEVLCCPLLITLHADMLRNRYIFALTVYSHSNNWKNCRSTCSAPLVYLNVMYGHKYSQQLLMVTLKELLINYDIIFSSFFLPYFSSCSSTFLFLSFTSLPRSEGSWMCWSRICRRTPCQSV